MLTQKNDRPFQIGKIHSKLKKESNKDKRIRKSLERIRNSITDEELK